MDNTVYLYESHIDGLFLTDEWYEPLICRVCNDRDSFVAMICHETQLRTYMEEENYEEGYIREMIDRYRKLTDKCGR